ncbi:MAG: extracellular solute-binding protein [Lachnospiraceae bacterium]|nr:extracellular solute-binding protein [Lachnospiraceae bacterium]
MKIRKAVKLLGMTILLSTVLSACGTKTETLEETTAEEQTIAASEELTAVSEEVTAINEEVIAENEENMTVSDEKTLVRLWCQPFTEVETQQWLENMVEEFNESDVSNEKNFYVELQWVTEDTWDATLKAAQGAGTQPEITVLNYAEVPLNSLNGEYTALDDYMSDSCFTDLLDNVEEMTNVNGNHYIYPWFVEPYSILFYRKSALEEAGAEVPTSWDELYECAKLLKENTEYEYGIAMPNTSQLGWVAWGFQAQDENAGYFLLSEDWQTADVNTEFHQQLFTLFQKMYTDELTPEAAFSSYNEIYPLAQGYVPMALGGSWSIGQIKNTYPDVLDDIGYAVCPTIDGETEGKTTAVIGGWGMAIDGKAEHPEECGAFIEWLLGGDTSHLISFMSDLGFSKFAARKSVEEALAEIDEAVNDPFYSFVSESILSNSKMEPVYEWTISEKYADALIKASKGEDVQSTLDDLQTELNRILKAGGQGTYPYDDLE